MKKRLRLLLVSTPVGPLGSGLGGGVELTVINLAAALKARGHRVVIAAPAGSNLPTPLLSSPLTAPLLAPLSDSRSAARLDKQLDERSGEMSELIQLPGTWQTSAQSQRRSAPVVTSSALSNAWDYARQVQHEYDLLINFAYDWLPFYLTPFFKTPVAHFVSMGSLSDAVDDAIARIGRQYPGTLGAYTRSQADTFVSSIPAQTVPAQTVLTQSIPTQTLQWQILGSAVDLRQYDYCSRPDNFLAWVGRISPEKGLQDALTAASLAHKPLKIFGQLEDLDYWQSLQPLIEQAPVPIEYCGFLPTAQLQKALGRAQGLLVTPHWLEAFGIVAIEAMACGVPVIAYERGGPAEVVRSGTTGWLVSPGDVKGLVSAIARIHQIDRHQCRQQAETLYSLAAWGERFEQWCYQIISGMMGS